MSTSVALAVIADQFGRQSRTYVEAIHHATMGRRATVVALLVRSLSDLVLAA